MNVTAQQLIEKLELEPHPEGGWFRFIRKSSIKIPKDVLPDYYPDDRYSVSTIYYLLAGDEKSRWHKLSSEEIWTWHCGSSLKMTLGGEGEIPSPEQVLYIGSDLARGDQFQVTVPAKHWQETCLLEGGFALVSCIVSPAYEEEDCYLPDVETMKQWNIPSLLQE